MFSIQIARYHCFKLQFIVSLHSDYFNEDAVDSTSFKLHIKAIQLVFRIITFSSHSIESS